MRSCIFCVIGCVLACVAWSQGVQTNASPRHVFSMTCKVTSCNKELNTSAGRTRAIAWFRRHHITKLWLESYRHAERVESALLAEERDAFHAAGFEVCGCITPTRLNNPPPGATVPPMVVCWSDPTARARLRDEVRRAAALFETVILDDFLFSSCGEGCARCKAEKAERGITDWGEFRRALLFDVCAHDILSVARATNANANFIIKYPCWWRNWEQSGYSPKRQAELFGSCWIGTETRDANPNPFQACEIVERIQRLTDNRCAGGWYDGLDSSPAKFIEQARYTILGGAKESLIHCYDYLVAEDPGLTPFGEKATRGPACAAALTAEIEKLQALGDFVASATRGKAWMRPDGVSEHHFTKDGRDYVIRLNTKAVAVDGVPPHGLVMGLRI